MLSLKECLWNKRSVAHLSKWCWCSIWTTFRLNILRTFLIDFKLFAKRAKRARIYTGKMDTFDHFLRQFFTCQETDGIRRDQAGFVEKSLKFCHTVFCVFWIQSSRIKSRIISGQSQNGSRDGAEESQRVENRLINSNFFRSFAKTFTTLGSNQIQCHIFRSKTVFSSVVPRALSAG